MKILALKNKTFRFFLICSFTSFIFQPVAYADLISTDQLVKNVQSVDKKSELMTMLVQDDLRNRMAAMGINSADIQNRINNMTDTELNQVLAGLDELPAGGDVLSVVLTVLIIMLILDLAEVTDIFPGV